MQWVFMLDSMESTAIETEQNSVIQVLSYMFIAIYQPLLFYSLILRIGLTKMV